MDVKVVISSPFLRCLQTGMQITRVLGQSGVITCNALCELLVPGSNIMGTPKVPGNDIEKYDIIIEQQDTRPLPSFPENRQKAEVR